MPAPPSDIKQPDRKLKARGLTVYISDIRNCTNREQEEERVYEELAHIRAKFSPFHATKPLSSYDKRKYVWKLVYTHLLGYDVDFGHIQAIELLAGTSYQDKLCGYLALSMLTQKSDEILTLIINTIKRDLDPINPSPVICLALCAVANIGGREMAPILADDVRKLAMDKIMSDEIRQKALLALLRLHRDFPEAVRLPSELEVVSNLEPTFRAWRHQPLVIMLTACALLRHMIEYNNAKSESLDSDDELEEEINQQALQEKQRPQVQTILVKAYHTLAVFKTCPDTYNYYDTAAPFLQVAILRCLRSLGTPPSEQEIVDLLLVALRTTLLGVKWTKSSNVNNASRCVAFEALALIAQYPVSIFDRTDVLNVCAELLGKCLLSRNSNTRYLVLGAMSRIARSVSARYGSHKEASSDPWQKVLTSQQKAIVTSLTDGDISVRKRALELLFYVCHEDNADIVIDSLLNCLRKSDDLTPEFKEELVLRIAVLAERYARSPKEYIDLAIQLLEFGGDYVGEDVWHRVVQIISNEEDMQQYAALRLYKALLSPDNVPSSLVKVAAYVIGEFGYLLTEYSTLESGDLDHDVLGLDLFGACHRHFSSADTATKLVLLTCYSKLLNIYEDLQEPVEEVFEQQQRSMDSEVQERAFLYLFLGRVASRETMHRVLEPMPPWAGASSKNKLEEQLDRLTKDDTVIVSLSPKAEAESTTQQRSSNKEEDEKGDQNRTQGVGSEPLLEEDGSYQQHDEDRSTAQIALLKKLYLNALLTHKSLLYDDGRLQFGSQQRFNRGEGVVELFIGNQSPTIGYENVYIEVLAPEMDALEVMPEGSYNGERFFMPPSAQLRFVYRFRCFKPFRASPEIRLMDTQTGLCLAQVKFPVALTSFLEPYAMSAQVFQAKWEQLESSPSLSSEMTCTPQFVSNSPTFASGLSKTLKLIDLLKLFRVPDWSPSSPHLIAEFAAAGVLLFANLPSPIGVLLRISVSENLLQTGVRTTLPSAARHLANIIGQQVSRLFQEE